MTNSAGRWASLSPDNHQPWLWFVHFLVITAVAWAALARVRIKWKQKGLSDAFSLAAHLFYIGYWIILLVAMLSSLGKSSRVSTSFEEAKASKLLFASRILLMFVLALEKLSSIFLVQEVCTREKTRLWTPLLAALALCQFFIGSLVVSVGCSPGRAIFTGDEVHCPGITARWIIITVFEAVVDIAIIIPIVLIVASLQMNLHNKMFAIAVFLARLLVWVPTMTHLTYFIQYINHGSNIIDIVPTIVIEEVWICSALILSAIPVIMRIALRFTTLGIRISTNTVADPSSQSSRSKQSSKSKSGPMARVNLKDVAQISGEGSTPRVAFRLEEDDGLNTIQVNAGQVKDEGTSIGSAAESQIGILRQVEFNVSSENK